MVDRILDTAGQKGTVSGRSRRSAEGVPLTLIGEAVFARSLSAMKAERVAAAAAFPRAAARSDAADRADWTEAIRQALYASKIVSYAQGYSLMRAAANTYGWDLNYGGMR
jgi:6-phosphogluconate dehydrogenase